MLKFKEPLEDARAVTLIPLTVPCRLCDSISPFFEAILSITFLSFFPLQYRDQDRASQLRLERGLYVPQKFLRCNRRLKRRYKEKEKTKKIQSFNIREMSKPENRKEGRIIKLYAFFFGIVMRLFG